MERFTFTLSLWFGGRPGDCDKERKLQKKRETKVETGTESRRTCSSTEITVFLNVLTFPRLGIKLWSTSQRISIIQLLWCHHTLHPRQPEGSPFIDLKLHLWLEKVRTHQFRKIYRYGCHGNLLKQFGCSVFCLIDVQDEWAETRTVHRDDMSRESVPWRLKGIWNLFTEMRKCLVDTIIGRLNRKSREFQRDLRNAPTFLSVSV